MGDRYTVLLPAPAKYLSANDRLDRFTEAAAIKQWRQLAWGTAKRMHLPKLQRVSIAARFYFNTNRDRDNENYYSTTKPIVDGLTAPKRAGQVGYGLIPDDTREHLASLSIDLHVVKVWPRSATRFGLVQLIITDLGEA